jgi:hypothetical protein
MKRYPLVTERIKEHEVRYVIKLEADDNVNKAAALMQLFRDLIDQPLLLRCGPNLAENISVRFNGERWILMATLEEKLDMTQVEITEGEASKSSGNPMWDEVRRMK